MMIKVTKVSEVKQDNGAKQEHRNYRTVEFSTPDTKTITDSVGKVITMRVKPKVTSLNLYEKSYLNNEMDFGYDANVGDIFEGAIETRKVTPYGIPFLNKEGKEDIRIVDTYTAVVLGDPTAENWEEQVKLAFRSRGHELAAPVPNNFSLAKEEVKEADSAKARVF